MFIFSGFRKFIINLAGITLTSFIFPSGALSADIHDWFESRCGECHQHMGDLAQESLTYIDGTLSGQTSGKDIRIFLPNHYGKPTPKETAALYDQLLWQIQAGRKFKTRCAICHVRARTLAQKKLLRDNDTLRGRYTGRDMTEFLKHHGRIDAEEVVFFIQLLTRLSPTTPPS